MVKCTQKRATRIILNVNMAFPRNIWYSPRNAETDHELMLLYSRDKNAQGKTLCKSVNVSFNISFNYIIIGDRVGVCHCQSFKSNFYSFKII